MVDKVLICSLNVRGMRDYKKRRELFHYFHKSEAGILLLQETHSTTDIEKQWRAEWGYTVLFAHGTNDSRGVCILIKNKFFCDIHNVFTDPNGRYIIIDITIGNKRLTLVNVYGPNQDTPAFFESIINLIEGIPNDNRVVGGDFNLVLDVDKDKRGGRPQTHTRAQTVVSAWMEETDLIDIWRIQNPDKFRFTWYKNNPNAIFCRLDFFLVSFGMSAYINNTDIKPGYKTDHSMITLTLSTEGKVRGKGFWKLNCSLLTKKNMLILSNTV